MAITTQMRTEISQLYLALFGRAPDGEGLGFWTALRNEGRSMVDIANTMYATEPARAYYPTFLTHQEIIHSFYVNVLGREPDAGGLAFWTAKLGAPAATFGSVVAEMIAVVANYNGTDPAGQASAALFNNRTNVAQYYGEKNGSVDGASAVLNTVTADPTTVPVAKTAIDNGTIGGVNLGHDYVLTVHQDWGPDFLGTNGNDRYLALAGQDGVGNLIDTLQSVDSLDGGDGIDALTLTVSQPTPIIATLKSIETIKVRSTNGDAILDLANASGVETIVVADSTAELLLRNIGTLANIGIRDQNRGLSLGGAAGSATTLNITAENVGSPEALTLDLGRTEASKAATANLTLTNARLKIDSTQADTLKTAHVAVNSSNELQFYDSRATLEDITVSGSGRLSLITGAGTYDHLTKFDASANTGGVLAALGTNAGALAMWGGAGADVFYFNIAVAPGASLSASMGAGDDFLLTGGFFDYFTGGADGGEGFDVIQLNAPDALSAAAAARVKNFEALDLSGAAPGNYDVSLLGSLSVQIDQALFGGLQGDITLTNAPDNFTLLVRSEAESNATFTLDDAITVQGRDYAGTGANAETFTLRGEIKDGNKDGGPDGGLTLAADLMVDGVEKIVVESHLVLGDGASNAPPAAAYSLRAKLSGNQVEQLVLQGDAFIDLSLSTTLGVLGKIDASGSTGGVGLDMSTHNRSVAVVGGSGRDTYIGSTAGDTFYGAGNVDALILEPGKAVRDTVVLKSATDSQWIASQANNGAYITLDNDRTEIDFVLNFSTAADATGDRLDLTGFGFTGAQRGLANVSARIGGTTSLNQLTDLFATPAGNRGAVYAVYGNDTFVFIDANKDGNFTVEADVAIQLAGVNAFSETSINF